MTKGETTLTLDLSALEHNFRFLKARLLPNTLFMGVVKAFAYGSDQVAIAKHLEKLGADYLAVAYAKEGIALREAGIHLPILVLHPQPRNFKKIIDFRLEPSLYSIRVLQEFLEMAKANKQQAYPVHLNFNTGLNRLGLSKATLQEAMAIFKSSNTIFLKGVQSHLAASEDGQERDFSLGQIADFKAICERLAAALGQIPIRHMLNTSGILNYPEAQFEMVRSGIGLYGYGNAPEYDHQLKPVATLKTVISQLHPIAPGDSVGYNRAYQATKPEIIATLPIGHADGLGRQYGEGKGVVVINGQPAPIVGNVCMDMVMVNVTHIRCQEGEEVLVFGADRSAALFAEGATTISYELLTAISPRVARIVV
ncbi:MAG: alanine racemase [Bacteroidota bacterium]